jgi:hypothetical protein
MRHDSVYQCDAQVCWLHGTRHAFRPLQCTYVRSVPNTQRNLIAISPSEDLASTPPISSEYSCPVNLSNHKSSHHFWFEVQSWVLRRGRVGAAAADTRISCRSPTIVMSIILSIFVRL